MELDRYIVDVEKRLKDLLSGLKWNDDDWKIDV
jgi:hypothetical protein